MPSAPCSGIANFAATGSTMSLGCTGSTSTAFRATGQTASITNQVLCLAASCPAGEYNAMFHIDSTATCSSPGAASAGLTVTFTDDAGTKTGYPVQLNEWSSGGGILMTTQVPLGGTAAQGYGNVTFWSTGVNNITFSTTYTACSTGTGTYSLSAEVNKLQ
jgi:hypothetical protein